MRGIHLAQNPTKPSKQLKAINIKSDGSGMHNHTHPHPLISLSLLTLSISSVLLLSSAAGPLFTRSRWIVDGEGRRVKMACVNWPAHLEVAVAEGLSHQPVDAISKSVAALGFNCIRLTWPTDLVTNRTVASTTVRESFEKNGLGRFLPGVQANNPSMLGLTLIQAFQAVVQSIAENGLMIILDNHLSRPGWCCGNHDGNGFFGDDYFNPDLWVEGLRGMAALFKPTPSVVGMSLRNELRGPKQNSADWYRYMQRGAEAVHAANPNVLIILSGLSYDLDLSFLKTRPLSVTFASRRKVAFEVHRYSFSGGRSSWSRSNANDVCGRVIADMEARSLFLPVQGWPLILTEFGADLTGRNENDNRFFSCLVGVAADHDLDWAYWELGGSYYRRFDVIALNETYGLLNSDWTPRNSSFMAMISSIQAPFRGPGVGNPTSMHQIIFHPSTGKCIVRSSEETHRLMLGPCSESGPWELSPGNGTLSTRNGTGYLYLQVQSQGEAVQLVDLESAGSTWKKISSSNMHLSTQLNDNKRNQTLLLCLDVGADGAVIAAACECLTEDTACNPASQWFKIINSARTTTTTT